MKTLIYATLIAASTLLASCAAYQAPATAAPSQPEPYQPPPKGWVCPMHGPTCPWVQKQRYCHYYDTHGYGSWRGGNCCRW